MYITSLKEERRIKADQYILALGFEPNQNLYDSLNENGKEAYLVGHAANPAKIFDAIHDAYRLALRIEPFKIGWK